MEDDLFVALPKQAAALLRPWNKWLATQSKPHENPGIGGIAAAWCVCRKIACIVAVVRTLTDVHDQMQMGMVSQERTLEPNRVRDACRYGRTGTGLAIGREIVSCYGGPPWVETVPGADLN
jgi:hypothetical protein